MLSQALSNILRISRCGVAYRKEKLTALGLSPSLHYFVSFACRHPGTTQEQLAAAFCVDKSTIAHQLMQLEREGYIERRVSEQDGRCRCIYPTEKALQAYPLVHSVFEAFNEKVIEGMSEEDQAELTRLTEIMCRNAMRAYKEGETKA